MPIKLSPLGVFATAAATLLLSPLQAQQGQNEQPPPRKVRNAISLFSCTLPGGVYKVAVRAIVGISSHEYIVEGTRVTEVNIDTQGVSQVRFYHLEILPEQAPNGIGQGMLNQLNEAVKTATQKTHTDEVWKKVVKNYPASTHARTIEYRLAQKEDLQKIFSAANEAFTQQKEVEISVP